MRLLLIEDESPALNRMIKMISEIDENIEIAGTCKSIKDSVEWLTKNNSPDLIILDVQLSDGSSLEIFKKVKVNSPVIFATAYDEHILEAFNFNAIDYLLKPIKKEKLLNALSRYKNLKTHFSKDIYNVLDEIGKSKRKYKERFLVKFGSSYQGIQSDDIAFFYTEHRVTFLVDSEGAKFIIDKTLSQLEDEIDPEKFFRLNRQFIVNLKVIKKFKPVDGGKLAIDLTLPIKEKILVSQEKASQFKDWLAG